MTGLLNPKHERTHQPHVLPNCHPRGCVKWLIIAIVGFEVIACAKGLARSADDSHSDIGISVVGLKRAVQLPRRTLFSAFLESGRLSVMRETLGVGYQQ